MYKQIAYTAIVRVITGIFNLVIAIIISNYIGAEGKGLQSLILATISLFVLLSGVVGFGGLTYLLPRYSFSSLIVPSYLWSLLSVLIMGGIAILLNIIPDIYIKHVILLAFINSINHINNSILQVKKRVNEINNVALIQIIILITTLVIYMVLLKVRNINVYITALYFSYFTSLLLSYLYTIKYYKNVFYNLNISEVFINLKKHFIHGGANQIDLFSQLLTYRFAFYYINMYLVTSYVGVYSNGVSIIESIWIISRSISYVQHTRIINSDKMEYTLNLTIRFIKLSFFLALLAVSIIIFIPSGFYQKVFGYEFFEMRDVILSLSPGVLALSVSFIISSFFSGIGKHYINMISSVLGLLLIIILSVLLIPSFGITGAGIAASITYFSMALIRFIFFYRKANLPFNQYLIKRNDINDLKKAVKQLFF